MPKQKFIVFFLFPILILFPDCKKSSSSDSQSQIPVVPVNISLNPNSTEYINLNVVSGWETITGGYRGIIVYHKSVNEFMAFDRACPNDWSLSTSRLSVDVSGVTASCPNCKSKFLLLDGSVYSGPSHYPMKQYETNYDGNLLYIYN